MPKRKVRKSATTLYSSRSYSRSTDDKVNFTFFKSKLFIALAAVALIVISMAVISGMNSSAPTSTYMMNDQYRIDTVNLKNDSSANQYMGK